MPHAIVVPRIEERDTRFDRSVDGGNAFLLIRRTVEVGHPHAAEPEIRYRWSILSENPHEAPPEIMA